MQDRNEQIASIALLKKHNGALTQDYSVLLNPLSAQLNEFSDKELTDAQEILKFCEDKGIQFIPCTSEDFPKRLLNNPEFPFGLFVKSNRSMKELFGNDRQVFAVIGTRDCSNYGYHSTRRITAEIKEKYPKAITVSGLAVGVDKFAHLQSIFCDIPTVAVLPCGPDKIYPSIHTGLAEEIIKNGGAIVSQFVPETAPIAINFLLRNHVIAGFCDTTIVVESKEKGGAIVTARIAKDYGKNVIAVPGRIDDVRSMGCNRLIHEKTAEIYIPNITI